MPYQTARAEEKSRQNNLYRGLGPVERDRLTAKKLVDYAQSRDPKLREEIILMNTSLARFMAFKFQSGEDLEDLVQVALIGLTNAVDRFQPDRGAIFSTFAVKTINGELLHHLRDKSWRIKVPRRIADLSSKIAKAKENLAGQLSKEPMIEELALALKVTEDDLSKAIGVHSCQNPVSLEQEISDGRGDDNLTRLGTLGALDPMLEAMVEFDDLRQAINSLAPHLKTVIESLYFRGLNQREIGKIMGGISQMTVSRLKARALEALRTILSPS